MRPGKKLDCNVYGVLNNDILKQHAKCPCVSSTWDSIYLLTKSFTQFYQHDFTKKTRRNNLERSWNFVCQSHFYLFSVTAKMHQLFQTFTYISVTIQKIYAWSVFTHRNIKQNVTMHTQKSQMKELNKLDTGTEEI